MTLKHPTGSALEEVFMTHLPKPIKTSRPPRPARNEPGTLIEQLRAIEYYLGLPEEIRRADRSGSWAAARWQTMPHSREVVA